MHITSVILDGFKSYATRTVISGFDRNFNAITGLNGSGKSNILDAICFVLGISHLQSVRVNNLQELVYKQGQARVTKASVSLVFSNKDKEESPPGYEAHDEIIVTRQIVVGGKCKYFINGGSAQTNRVQSLFQSVHLNINNPHFLIMQGKITKVLGMKPLEILAMLEEAAGTRMYETKRSNAQRVFRRKESKLAEIDRTLEDEVAPLLEKLRKQKSHYLTWSSNNTEIERLTRFRVAYAYHTAAGAAGEREREKAELGAQQTEFERELGEKKGELERCEAEINRLEEENTEVQKTELNENEALAAELSKSLIKEKAVLENKNSAIKDERKSVAEFEESLAKAKSELEKTEILAKENQNAFIKAKTALNSFEEQFSSLQGRQLGFAVGDGGQNSKGSLTAQLIQSRRKKAELESSAKNIRFKLENLDKAIAAKRADLKEDTFEKENQLLSAKKGEIEDIERELNELKTETQRAQNLDVQIKEIESRIASMTAQLEKNAFLDFAYSSPHPNFDRSQVHGYAATLFTVKEKTMTTAVEIAAGGRLQNVVIESQAVGKALLKSGRLERRVTMIPLDKVSARRVADSVVEEARQAAGSKEIRLAIDCIDFHPRFLKAMEFIFASTLVCPDLTTAKRVAYGTKGLKLRAVSLDGELFEPHGTLTGGFRAQADSLLSRAELARGTKAELARLGAQASLLSDERRALGRRTDQRRALEQRLQIKRHELAKIEGRAQFGAAAAARKEIAALEKTRAAASEDAERVRAELEKVGLAVDAFEAMKEGGEEGLEREICVVKAKIGKAHAEVEKLKRKFEYDEAEIRTLKTDIEKAIENNISAEANLSALMGEAESLSQSIGEINSNLADTASKATTARLRLDSITSALAAHKTAQTALTAALSATTLALKKAQNSAARLAKSDSSAREHAAALAAEHAWLKAESAELGRPGGDYDFAALAPDVALARLRSLTAEQAELARRINRNVLAMFDKAEADCGALTRKRKIVLSDKAKIERLLAELDRKKVGVLDRTFAKVGADFGDILSELLPGARGRLEPAGDGVLSGVAARVALAEGAWKESLTELSGGQRSLMALALILALLRFRPAPVYILDEIDAALDLSHTRSIGRLLGSGSRYFDKAQFVVVSLKEGLFDSANALFKVRFEGGVSRVTRVAGRGELGE